MVFRAIAALAVAILLSLTPTVGAQGKGAPKCPACSNEVAPADRVVVTDFRAKTETAYCGVWCALKTMGEKYPASRAIARSALRDDSKPNAEQGREIRIIRTGVHWVIVPDTAVFLVLPEKEFPPAQRWRVFYRQAEYMQFLLRHRDLIKHKPKLARLPELVRLLGTGPPHEKPDAPA